jgi:hypothetical protein
METSSADRVTTDAFGRITPSCRCFGCAGSRGHRLAHVGGNPLFAACLAGRNLGLAVSNKVIERARAEGAD